MHPIAVSDRDREVTLWVPTGEKTRLLNSSTIAIDNPSRDASWDAVKVPARRLDSIVDSEVGFIKIDVEGHEAAVLTGANRLIHKSRPNLVIEIEQRHLGHDPAQVFGPLPRAGLSRLVYVAWQASFNRSFRLCDSSAARESDRFEFQLREQFHFHAARIQVVSAAAIGADFRRAQSE